MNPWFYVTVLGDNWIWIIALAALAIFYLFYRKRMGLKRRLIFKKFLFIAILSVTLSLVIVFGLKNLFMVERPCIPCLGEIDCNPYCETDSSFPSGHAAIAFAGFGSIFLVFRRKPVLILPIIVAMSRVLLGVHTAIDVVAGSLIGIVICWVVYKKILNILLKG